MGRKGAQLRHPILPFTPDPRKKNKNTVDDETKATVQECYEGGCAVSSCAKDRVRIRKGPMAYIVMPVLILLTTITALYTSYTVAAAAAGASTIAFKTFWSLRPPNLQRARHESCLCKCYENFSCYEKPLQEAVDLLGDVYADEGDEDEDPDDPDPILQDAQCHYLKLLQFVQTERRIEKVHMCLCPDAFDKQSEKCIECKCDACGFQQIWSKGLRPKLVQPDGQLKACC